LPFVLRWKGQNAALQRGLRVRDQLATLAPVSQGGWGYVMVSGLELLTPQEMRRADALTIAAGTPGAELMERAGHGVAAAARRMMPGGQGALVLCGPGNNGGDGFVAARLLALSGVPVTLLLAGQPEQLSGDAWGAWRRMGEEAADRIRFLEAGANPFQGVSGLDTPLVIDALFGAGLSRSVSGYELELINGLNASGLPVLSVDVPSGLDGATGEVRGVAVKAVRTVTFCRMKPGHLLLPGRLLCGEVEVCDIGISNETVLAAAGAGCWRNGPELWGGLVPRPRVDGHKFSRGHAVAFSGPAHATGAIRLSAMAALRSGAGLVTVACEPSATMVLANHLTSVMLHPLRGGQALAELLADSRITALVYGPAAGLGTETQALVLDLVASGKALVLDADALSSFAGAETPLFVTIEKRVRGGAQPPVLTPHAGEFARLFPDLSPPVSGLGKLDAARAAAQRSKSVIIYKGPDTVIAAPDGRAAINANGTPWLATAGSGDVLAGIVAGLLAQGLPPFEAAAMGVWMHGRAAEIAGAGLVAEDLLPALKSVVEELSA
jgi:hydroxyethylthiazole kinase-like uncharacterized protein yjeF